MKEIKISIGNGRYLVAYRNSWYDEFPDEICCYIESENGEILQDICIVRQHYDVSSTHHNITNDIDVLVFADKNDEDYTDKYVIEQYEN